MYSYRKFCNYIISQAKDAFKNISDWKDYLTNYVPSSNYLNNKNDGYVDFDYDISPIKIDKKDKVLTGGVSITFRFKEHFGDVPWYDNHFINPDKRKFLRTSPLLKLLNYQRYAYGEYWEGKSNSDLGEWTYTIYYFTNVKKSTKCIFTKYILDEDDEDNAVKFFEYLVCNTLRSAPGDLHPRCFRDI